MKKRQINAQTWIFIVVFVIAVLFRFLNLGKAPLSDYEADWALRSWEAVFNNKIQIGANPTYFTLTNLLFYLFGGNNFLARFWPALLGSLIVWIPFGFRDFLGDKAAVIMGVGLALDPGLVAVSRIAGGPMMALGFFLFTLLFVFLRKPVWAGVFGGLGLGSGHFFYLGLIGLLIAWGINHRIDIHFVGETLLGDNWLGEQTKDKMKMIRQGLLSASLTVIFVSVIFSGFPGGLGGLGNSIITFFQGWISPSKVPVLKPSLTLVFYQPLAILFASIALIRSWYLKGKLERWSGVWLLTALVLTAVYSNRFVFDSIWAIIPLWVLASMELVRYIKLPEAPTTAFGQSILLFTLCVIAWLVSTGPGFGNLTVVILIVVPVLALLTTLFVGLGWSWNAARIGAAWGIILTLGIYTVSATFGAAHQRQNAPVEFWYPEPAPGQADLFLKTLEDLSLRTTGRNDWIQTTSLVDSKSLRWLLRDVHGVTFLSDLEPVELPVIIVTPGDDPDLSRTMSYRGQDFTWYEYAGWSGPLPEQLWTWIASRNAELDTESIVLWARSDLFPEDQGKNENEQEMESSADEKKLEDGSPD